MIFFLQEEPWIVVVTYPQFFFLNLQSIKGQLISMIKTEKGSIFTRNVNQLIVGNYLFDLFIQKKKTKSH